jgi:hypothetical protein
MLLEDATRRRMNRFHAELGPRERLRRRQVLSEMHFFTEASFAAPASGLPSLLTAAVSQHFLIADVLAAPASGLPSLLTASFLQDCASAGLTLIGERKAVALMKHASVAAVVMILVIGAS